MPAKGTRRTVWFNSQEWPLVEGYLKANDLPLSRLVRRLVLDHILAESEGDDEALLKDLLAQSEPNTLRPQTQISLLKAVRHNQLLLGEVLAAALGDRKEAHQIYNRVSERAKDSVSRDGYLVD